MQPRADPNACPESHVRAEISLKRHLKSSSKRLPTSGYVNRSCCSLGCRMHIIPQTSLHMPANAHAPPLHVANLSKNKSRARLETLGILVRNMMKKPKPPLCSAVHRCKLLRSQFLTISTNACSLDFSVPGTSVAALYSARNYCILFVMNPLSDKK